MKLHLNTMKNVFGRNISLLRYFGFLAVFLAMSVNGVWGQISLTSVNTPFTQDFNTLAYTAASSTVPSGWAFSESGSSANTTYSVGTGSDNTGDTYSFGSYNSTERAFGGLYSSSLTTTIGASYTNNTSSVITQLAISYYGEQWRIGATSRIDKLSFSYSTDATSLTTGTWTNVTNLDFTAPITTGTLGALDGNATANRSLISYTISGLNITNGTTFWIKFLDYNATGADDGLGIDDWSITANASSSSTPPTLTADATNNTVDNDLEITFTDDATWRNAVTAVKVGTTTLSNASDYLFDSGILYLIPGGGNSALTTSGSKTITVVATGFSDATVTQVINSGVAASLTMKTQPVAPSTNGGTFATQPEVNILDQYGNLTTGTVVASKGDAGTWTLGGTTSKVASSGVSTYTDLTASSAAAVSNAYLTFTLGSLSVNSSTFNIPTPATTPIITVIETTVPAMSAVVGSTDAETITIGGTNLTGNITLALSGTNAAMFSVVTTPSPLTSAGGTATITYTPTVSGSHTATLTLSSAGAADVTRTLSGTATLAVPVATNASGISTTGFTANWGAVNGATGYDVNVYTKTSGGTASETEGFDGITPDVTGKLISSATYLSGWSASSQSATRQIYTSATNFGTASPSFALTTTGDYVETKTYSNPITNFSFWAKDQKGAVTSTSTTLIEGFNGTAWSTISTLSNVDAVTAGTKTYDLISLGKTDVIKIRMTFTKIDGNLAIDDIAVTYGGTTFTPISGSPFSVTSTNNPVTGLTPSTAYYYTVMAKDGTSTTAASNEKVALTAINTSIGATTLPDCPSCDIVVATGGQLTVNANKTYNKVTVNAGGKLTLAGGSTLTAPLTIQSDGTSGTGTYVDENTGTGLPEISATVQQYITGTRSWYVSSPINVGTTSMLLPAAETTVNSYNEATNNWDVQTGNLTPGKGYFAQTPTGSLSFNGTLNNGSVSVQLTRSAANTVKPGFNLLGNPYPSYFNIFDAFDTDASGTITTAESDALNILPTYWYRSKSSGTWDWDTYNFASGITSIKSGLAVTNLIPPMQAFWVRVKTESANTPFVFTNSLRTHQDVTGNKFRAPATVNAVNQILRLQVAGNGITDESVIYFNTNAANGFDMYDSPKILNGSTSLSPDIYTLVGSEELVINGMNNIPYNTEIPLYFKANASIAASFTLKASEISNLEEGTPVYIKNNLTGEQQLISDGSDYTFNTSDAIADPAFSLIIKAPGAVTDITNPDDQQVLIYANANRQITVTCKEAVNVISVYNAVGQNVFTGKTNKTTTVIDNSFTPGIYLVNVNNVTKKVVVR